jgi:hypothetical protein
MEKKEINNIELIFCSSKRDSLNTSLRIIFQDLDDGDVYLIELVIDSAMTQILEEHRRDKTTNQLINSIIKRSIHKAQIINDIDKLKEYVWNPLDFQSIKDKVRDIKINQIII